MEMRDNKSSDNELKSVSALQTSAGEATRKLGEEARTKEPLELTLAFAIPKHESISDAGLSASGLGGTARAEVKGGNRSQDISPSTRNLPTHHFDDNMLKESLAYTNQSQNKLNKMLAKNYTEADAPKILEEFGQRLHTLQDFYAHSNYVEIQLKANPHLKPQDIPLMSWNDIPAGKADKIHTGFTIPDETTQIFLKRADVVNSLNQAGMKIPGTQFLRSDFYDKISSFPDRLNYFTNPQYSVLHRDLNKDDSHSEEGHVVNPYTGINLYDYARDLATRETTRQWNQLESTVKRLHGAQEGNMILRSLKTIQIYPPDHNGN